MLSKSKEQPLPHCSSLVCLVKGEAIRCLPEEVGHDIIEFKVHPLHSYVHKSEPAPVGAANISIEDFAVGSTILILTVLFPYPDENRELQLV